MPKEIMTRKASDNKYLHKDFHAAFNQAIIYAHKRFGEDAVREYLRQFAKSFYAPLTESIAKTGLPALKAHFEKIYAVEDVEIEIFCSDDELLLKIPYCPAVTHIKKNGGTVSDLFFETTVIVNETICHGTPFASELVEYDAKDGRAIQRFYRREK